MGYNPLLVSAGLVVLVVRDENSVGRGLIFSFKLTRYPSCGSLRPYSKDIQLPAVLPRLPIAHCALSPSAVSLARSNATPLWVILSQRPTFTWRHTHRFMHIPFSKLHCMHFVPLD